MRVCTSSAAGPQGGYDDAGGWDYQGGGKGDQVPKPRSMSDMMDAFRAVEAHLHHL